MSFVCKRKGSNQSHTMFNCPWRRENATKAAKPVNITEAKKPPFYFFFLTHSTARLSVRYGAKGQTGLLSVNPWPCRDPWTIRFIRLIFLLSSHRSSSLQRRAELPVATRVTVPERATKRPAAQKGYTPHKNEQNPEKKREEKQNGQWHKYSVDLWCLRLRNLQRSPLDLLAEAALMGNDDTDGLTAILPGGHLEQLTWWLIEKETCHWPWIDFFFFSTQTQELRATWTLTFDSWTGGHCQCLFHHLYHIWTTKYHLIA